jgi:hypothetical protein
MLTAGAIGDCGWVVTFYAPPFDAKVAERETAWLRKILPPLKRKEDMVWESAAAPLMWRDEQDIRTLSNVAESSGYSLWDHNIANKPYGEARGKPFTRIEGEWVFVKRA